MAEINTELLEKVMQYILDHPEEHDQSQWFCGTTACFAGHTALLSGYRLPHPLGQNEAIAVVVDKDGKRHYVDDLAIELLGLTCDQGNLLFGASNNLEQLQLTVRGLINGQSVNEVNEEILSRD